MIVAAVNFSKRDRDTLACARGMANLLAEPILLVHVVTDRRRGAFEAYDHAAKRLYAMADEIGADVFPELLDGDVVTSLNALAMRLRPRLMVVGGQNAERYDGVEHAAARLSRRLACPLLVAGNTGGLAKQTFREQPLRVLVPCDMTHNVDAALRAVRQLRPSAAVDCEVVHYYRPPGGKELSEDGLRCLVAEAGCSFRVESTLGAVALELASEARERNVDLIVLATHQRNVIGRALHPSVREALLDAATVPVLFVPIASAARAS